MADEAVSAWESKRYVPKPGEPELPPQLAEFSQKSVDDVITELNRLPFFMNQLDETDGEGGENVGLEALKSLAYDGEPDEVATNFKNQGNDCFKAKKYKDAIEFYTSGLDMDCKVDSINSALYVNRAACNLELKNYRRCIDDCKRALLIDEHNVKACYRAGRAFFLVDRYDEARQILQFGLTQDPQNAAIKDTLQKVEAKEKQIADAKKKKEDAERKKQLEQSLLSDALKLRHYEILKSARPVEMLEDAKLRLEDPADYESQLIFPAMVLYPTKDLFDFVAEVSELSTPNEILELVLDRLRASGQDPLLNFTLKDVNCYMETTTGGLVQVGKKAPIQTALGADKAKAPLFDNSLQLYVVPKAEAQTWIGKWNKVERLAQRNLK